MTVDTSKAPQAEKKQTNSVPSDKNQSANKSAPKHDSTQNPRTRPRSPTVDLPTKRRRKHGKQSKPRRDTRKSRYDADYTGDDEKTNVHFEAYYRHQEIVAPSEYEKLFSTLATPLPTSFRITASGKFCERIQERLKGEMTDLFRNVQRSERDGEKVEINPPSALPWYPSELAWTVTAPRQMLRRDNVLSPFHKFLVQMNDLGAINRQEAVSMIPPLMLDVHPGQKVIDLCAAPGSKTAQILETLSGGGGEVRLKRKGLVVANDADIRRCWMLAHQLKRFSSPDLVVTNHDAQHFPKVLLFDRVLCDVPCTGDGTMRKAPDIWRRWTPDMGIGIHRLQRQIAERGLDLLKPGGRMVYSTCSMNPLENEAVVASLLRKYKGEVELMDCDKDLPGLKRRPGLKTWKVKDNSSNVQKESENGEGGEGNGEKREENGGEATGKLKGWFLTFDEVPMRRRKKIVETLFPPSKEELGSGQFPLERCMRLVPHDQDTGGFFVAVLQKKEDARIHRKMRKTTEKDGESQSGGETGAQDVAMTHEEDNSNQKVVEEEGTAKGKGKAQKGTRLITDDPLVSLAELNKDMLDNIVSYFGISGEIGERSLMTRGSDGEKFKRVVAVSPQVRELLEHSLGSRDGKERDPKKSVRVVNAGVRVLERTDRRDTSCPFRVIHEGVELMREVMQKRVSKTTNEQVMKRLAVEDAVRLDSLECRELKEELTQLSSGSCIIEGEGEVIVGWKGRSNVAAVMPREQLTAVRQRLGVAEPGPDNKETTDKTADKGKGESCGGGTREVVAKDEGPASKGKDKDENKGGK